MNEDCIEDNYEPRNPGYVSIGGEIAGHFDWDGLCAGSLQFCTNGPQGGDAGYGGFLRVTFINSASTCVEVAVDGAEPKPAGSIMITFRGDAEIKAAMDCFEFLAAKLKSIRELRN
jgi:hypothetical protein